MPWGSQFSKGMNNFIYGKFLQNMFKQMNLKFLNTIEDAIHTQSLPGFVRNTSTMVTLPLLMCTMRRFTVISHLPGAAITELAKLHMYWFFYDQVIHSGDVTGWSS